MIQENQQAGLDALKTLEVKALKEELEKLPRSKRGSRYGIHEELRSRILKCWRMRNIKASEFSKELGLGESTVQSWKHREGKHALEKKFKKLVLPHFEEDSLPIVVESPQGVKIRGLNLDQLAQLLRALC